MTFDDDEDAGGQVVALPERPRLEAVPPPLPADEPEAAYDIREPGERIPVIPVPFHRENLGATLSSSAALTWHRTRYHGLRLPAYTFATLTWAVLGVFRVLGRQLAWWWVAEMQHPMTEHADQGAAGSRDWHRMHKERKQTRKVRGYILLAEAFVIAAAVITLLVVHLWYAWLAAAVFAVPLLALAGKPPGHRIVSPAVVPPQYEPLSREGMTLALGSLGIGKIDQVVKPGGPGLNILADPHKDGPGWTTHIDLPHGVTARMIVARRAELASGLRRPLSAVWPEPVPHEHEGRLSLWVGYHDISRLPPAKWPLAKAGMTADLFAGIPFGTDPRQRTVTGPMFEANWLIGAAPGEGKTSALRVLACAAALDVRADLWVHELAGKGDLEPLEQVCHRYVSGLHDDAIAYTAESVRMLRALLERRSMVFGKLPRADKPDGKLTPELAARGFRLIVFVIDEVQNLMVHPEYGQQAAEDLAHIIRLGRATGIIVILATQRPDKDMLPTAISGIVTARFCLKVPDQVGNDMILGTGSYRAGYNSTLLRHETDAGMGWLKATADPQIVRTYYIKVTEAGKIAARARAMREKAHVLSGHAVGLDDSEVVSPRDVLGDLLEVIGSAPAISWVDAAQALGERWPARWANVSDTALSAQARHLGVPSQPVSVDGVKARGCRRASIEEAMRRG